MADHSNSQNPVTASPRVPFAFALLAVLGLFAGIMAAAWAESVRLGAFVTIGVPAIPFAVWSVARRRKRTSSLQERERLSAQESSAGALALCAVLLGVAIVVAGTYWRAFWLVTVLGFLLALSGWKYRSSHSFRGAMAFIGVLVAIYGVLGWYVVIKSR